MRRDRRGGGGRGRRGSTAFAEMNGVQVGRYCGLTLKAGIVQLHWHATNLRPFLHAEESLVSGECVVHVDESSERFAGVLNDLMSG